MDLPKLDFLKSGDNTIPIPSLDHLRKAVPTPQSKEITETKYEREYDAFCRWMALPKELREPSTLEKFERKWKLPKTKTSYFRTRADFQQRRLKYFWDWMFDNFPDVVNVQMQKAIKDKDTNAAKFFAEILDKSLDLDKPKKAMTPFVIVGVEQEKLNRLFTPEGYDKVEDVIPVEDGQ